MAFTSRYPPGTRLAVEALLRESSLTMTAIAERGGVSYAAVRLWNRKAGLRPPTRAAGSKIDPVTWTAGRIAAAARLLGRDDIDRGDLAEAIGVRRGDVPALMRACGLAARRTARTRPPGAAPGLATLGAVLRAHIARQIAAFDERLHAADAAAPDTAKILRDLGGLKRLLDDLGDDAHRSAREDHADGGAPQDLAALRERLARRLEAFAREPDPAAARVPGAEPSEPPGVGLADARP